jgi:hypothetical protein
MKGKIKWVGIAAATLALGAAPALATGRPSDPGSQGSTHSQAGTHEPSTPGPNASLPAKAKAYGRFCQGESKNHVAGQKGTAFSRCVTDMAKLSHGQSTRPTAACSNESKKKASGQKRSDFSTCVEGGAKLLRSQHHS